MSLTVADLFERDVRERAATRVFDIQEGRSYVCKDGYCVAGALLREAGVGEEWISAVPTPTGAALAYLDDPRRPRNGYPYTDVRETFDALIRANDRGDLATPEAVRRALMLEES